MPSMNKVILIGHLGQDPVVRKTQTDQSVCNFSMATTEKFKDKETTEWHNIVVWGKSAENAAKYLKKGACVLVEGRITTRSWEDKDGNKCYKTEVVADPFGLKFMDRKPQAEVKVAPEDVPF